MTTNSKTNELQVSLSDFIDVLKSTKFGVKLGKKNINKEVVVFSFDGSSLNIDVMGVDHRVSAKGVWSGSAFVPLRFIGLLRKAPPNQDPLILSYLEPKMRIGDTSFVVEWKNTDIIEK